MFYLTHDDLKPLAIGCKLLGSGGGGDPDYEALTAHCQLSRTGSVAVVPVVDIADDALVVPLGFVGAPLVIREKLPSGRELASLLHKIEQLYGRRVDYLLPAEIGGSNGLTPLTIASSGGYPLLDGDLVGRAYPKLHMASANLHSIRATPALIADALGKTVTIDDATPEEVEELTRHLIVAMGSSAAIATYIMTGVEAKRAIIQGSISLALKIGQESLKARHATRDPIEPLYHLFGGRLLGEGTIIDHQQRIERAFLMGDVMIQGEGGILRVSYQNEYLQVVRSRQRLAATPEIIAICDSESGEALSSDQLPYGLVVKVIALPSPPLWSTAEGLALVGPDAFFLSEED